MFKSSPEETVLVAQILAQLQVKRKRCEEESVPVEDVFNLLQGAKLSDDILWHVLSIADRNEKGKLERQDLGVAVRLIGWAQIGVEVSWDWINRCGPTAVISGLPVLREPGYSRGLAEPSIRRQNDNTCHCYPPFSSQKRAKYVRVFMKNKPVDGRLGAQRVWSAFVLSKLSWLTLADIWDIVDVEDSGDLTMSEFLIAMYFIDGLMYKKFTTLPSTIPAHIYEQAVYPNTDDTLSDLQHQSRSRKNRRGGKQRWGISIAIQSTASAHLGSLDPGGTGRITIGAFMDYFDEQCFPSSDSTQIWKIVNVSEKQTISKDEYAVALFLFHRKLVGVALPVSLPPILVPPSIRSLPPFQSLNFNDGWDSKAETPTEWHISDSVRVNAVRIFSVLDFKSQGFVEQSSVICFMKESKLPAQDLTQIWKLTGLAKTINVTPLLFTITLFFIHWRLADLDLPKSLPEILKSSTQTADPLVTHDISIDPKALSSVQDCRRSLRELTTENQRLRQHRLSLDQDGTSAPVTAPIFTSPTRPHRPPPRPISVPLSELDASFDLNTSWGTPENDAASEDLRSEVDQLRLMIQSLMADNETLRNSVHQIQARDDAPVQNISANAGEDEDLPPPPPYEEWISDSNPQ